MEPFRIALLQLAACGNDQEANREKGERYCRRAREQSADLALFPEMWNIGYTPFDAAVWDPDFDPADPRWEPAIREWQAQAIDERSAFITSFQRLARELEMAIALTYLEIWPAAPRNTVSVIDRRGEIVLTYAKVHTCDFSLEAACTPGETFPVCTLETTKGPVRLGAMICYDREFPESARILMLNGAEIILTPNACPLEENRLAQFRTRAYENMVGVAMANYAGAPCNGRSVAFEPVAFGPDGTPHDPLLVQAGETEGIYLANFDLERIRAYRQQETWGNAFRKPRTYGALTSEDVAEPFIRRLARR